MSDVTNVILATAAGELDGHLAAINGWLARCGVEDADEAAEIIAYGGYGEIVAVDDPRLPDFWYGGAKALEVDLAIGAFNFFRLDGFAAFLGTLKWRWPAAVQLIVRRQEDEAFSIIAPLMDDKGRERQLVDLHAALRRSWRRHGFEHRQFAPETWDRMVRLARERAETYAEAAPLLDAYVARLAAPGADYTQIGREILREG